MSIAPVEGDTPTQLLRLRKDQNGFSKENLPNVWRFQAESAEADVSFVINPCLTFLWQSVYLHELLSV
jgi:hypothetical protein